MLRGKSNRRARFDLFLLGCGGGEVIYESGNGFGTYTASYHQICRFCLTLRVANNNIKLCEGSS